MHFAHAMAGIEVEIVVPAAGAGRMVVKKIEAKTGATPVKFARVFVPEQRRTQLVLTYAVDGGADVVKVINIEAGTWEAGKFYVPLRGPRLALPVTVPSAAPFPELFFCIGHFAESKQIRTFVLHAGVLELVDNPDLGSGALRRMGSSPFTRTKESHPALFCAIYRFTHRGTNPPDPLRRYAPKSFDSSFYKTPGACLGHQNGFSGY